MIQSTAFNLLASQHGGGKQSSGIGSLASSLLNSGSHGSGSHGSSSQTSGHSSGTAGLVGSLASNLLGGNKPHGQQQGSQSGSSGSHQSSGLGSVLGGILGGGSHGSVGRSRTPRSRFFLLTRYSTASRITITGILPGHQPLAVTLAPLRLPIITPLAPPPIRPTLDRRILANPATTTNIPVPTRSAARHNMHLRHTLRRSVISRSMHPRLAPKVRHHGDLRRKVPRRSHLHLHNHSSTTREPMALHRMTSLKVMQGTSIKGLRRVLTGSMEDTATPNTCHHPLLGIFLRAAIVLYLTGSHLLTGGTVNRHCSISRSATPEVTPVKHQTDSTAPMDRGSIRLDIMAAQHHRSLDGN